MGAVNVIRIQGKKLKGFNTDVQGFSRFLEEAAIFSPNKAVVLGAGGAAKSVIYSLFKFGIGEIDFFSRSLEKMEIMIKKFENYGNLRGHKWKLDDMESMVKHSDLVINATPVGMFPFLKDSPLDIKHEARNRAMAVDLIYNPNKTEFLRQAQKKGYRIHNGLDMLIYQGIDALKIWLEHSFNEKAFILQSKKVLQKALRKQS